MKLTVYSHNFGHEATPNVMLNSLLTRLSEIKFEFRWNTAPELRKEVLEAIMELGWSDQVKVNKEHNITITSMQNSVGLCLQFGNMARFYADILKLEVLHQKDTAASAIYILPTKKAARSLGSNIVHYDRFTEELSIFKHIITIPIAVIGIEGDDA